MKDEKERMIISEYFRIIISILVVIAMLFALYIVGTITYEDYKDGRLDGMITKVMDDSKDSGYVCLIKNQTFEDYEKGIIINTKLECEPNGSMG